LFVIDNSRSMDYPGIREQGAGIRTKFQLAQSVAAILGTLVLDQGDAAGLLAVDDRAHYVPARSGRHHLRVFLAELSSLQSGGAKPVSEALRRAATILKRRGLIVVVSDLYEDATAVSQVKRLARMGHDVIVIHTLSQHEIDLDVGGAAEFVDLETGTTLMVQPSAIRDAYVSRVRAWLSDVEREVRRDGIDYLRLTTGEPLEAALRRFLLHRRGVSQ
jgi:uncharacterized protein (DUF58 family)